MLGIREGCIDMPEAGKYRATPSVFGRLVTVIQIESHYA